MRTYKAMAVLLGYPEREWLAALPELAQVLEDERRANQDALQRVGPLFARLHATPLLVLQADYVDTFDRIPAHSLHLFEHIHGESRARGQAMADLVGEYARRGLEIGVRELPDYLPLFLEYLSLLPDDEARDWLGHVTGVLAAIGARLAERGSAYRGAFAALARLAPARAGSTPAPVRDMERLLAATPPAPDGVEPLFVPNGMRPPEGRP